MTNSKKITRQAKIADVVLVPFPFTDLLAKKKRPALILSSFSSPSLPTLVVVAMITSKIEGTKFKGDVSLKDWQKAGLLHPSKVRLGKLVTLEASLIQKILGSLSLKDQAEIKKPWQDLFGHWL